jgi:hypothetical protein
MIRCARAMYGVAALSTIASTVAAQSSAARVHVGPNVQISRARGADTHYEVLAATDPTDASRLIVGSIVYPEHSTTFSTVVYSSFDGGKRWTETLGGPALEHTGDPACAYAPDGTAYYVASSIPPRGERRMLLFRSPDGGKSWEQPATAFTYSDREYITVDATGGRYDGRVYVNGNNRIPRAITDFVVFSSDDGGRTFRGPGTRAGFGQFRTPSMGNAVVASDGTLVGIFAESRADGPGTTLNAITSIDGGASLAPAVTISDFVAGGGRKGTDNNVNAQPILAIDGSSGP